jgi:hypothetical protein
MLSQTTRFPTSDRAGEQSQRVDAAVSETVISMASAADRQRLRTELLKLIIKNEARRKQSREFHGVVTTDGSANSSIEAVDS